MPERRTPLADLYRFGVKYALPLAANRIGLPVSPVPIPSPAQSLAIARKVVDIGQDVTAPGSRQLSWAATHPKQAVQNVKDAALNTRAAIRGFEDAASGGRANEARARFGAALGLGNGANSAQRQADLLAREAAWDAQDRIERPEARNFGRDIPTTAEYFGRAALYGSGLDRRPEQLLAMHQLLNNREIGHPGVGESAIPVWGPAREFAADYQDEDYLGAGLNLGFALTDLIPSRAAGRGGFRVFDGTAWYIPPKPGLSDPYAWDRVRRWMGDTGQLGPGQIGHHGLIRQPKKGDPDWYKRLANQPWNITPMPDWVTHDRIHGQFGQRQLALPERLWLGMPPWTKEMAPYPGRIAFQGIENAGEDRD